MNVSIDTTSGNDQAFSCQSLCGSANNHAWGNAIHDVWVTSLTDTSDQTVTDTDICLVDACVVEDQSVCDNEIQLTVCGQVVNCLAHTVTEGFTATELGLFAVCCVILLNFDNEVCVSQSNLITNSWAVHHAILCC